MFIKREAIVKKEVKRPTKNITTMEFAANINEGIKYDKVEKHRENLREVLVASNATPLYSYGCLGFSCCYCRIKFNKPSDVKKHTLEEHLDRSDVSFTKYMSSSLRFVVKLDITSLQCTLCNKDIDSLNELFDHLIIEHNKNIHRNIKNHIMPFKFDTDELQCCMCNSAFNKFKSLSNHMSVHYRNYVCKHCGMPFVNLHGYNRHIQRQDTSSYPCNYCSKVFPTATNQKNHIRMVHEKAAIFKCSFCPEILKNYLERQKHFYSVHGVDKPSCKACDKVFNSYRALGVHVKRMHLLETRFNCTQCDMKFFSKREIDSHMVKHTGIKLFECHICKKSYTRECDLKQHVRAHDKKNWLKCEYCDQMFALKGTLQKHKKTKHEDAV